MDELCGELENILKSEAIETLFQPIVDLKTAEIIGYEALSRGHVGSDLYSPVELIRVRISVTVFGQTCYFRK
ncbi:hypothetical protein [Fusibacter tunisiensis]|uniref:EAL domain-containing protein (Putative c-di-GMP-specific phosphodiesterase class I) n=1 Tax=Fusibacter tunisiensis TaxID=1008308 RepID=A0ABS2MQB9_9FIRM|nr:hypothetical protein [Fusibacter tunisiensis]MBM7561608.1 EAL domain-containing protein (putative c-di-GMP-specific phosphodiesterase class I) [Fusibacter tunisiensis]